MKKIILRDEEYEILQKVLRAAPPAQILRIKSGQHVKANTGV